MIFADGVMEALASLDVEDVAMIGLVDFVFRDLFTSILGADFPVQLRVQFLADCFADDSDDEGVNDCFVECNSEPQQSASSIRKRVSRKAKREGPLHKKTRTSSEPKLQKDEVEEMQNSERKELMPPKSTKQATTGNGRAHSKQSPNSHSHDV
jgi:hypothetical protein